MAALQDVRQAGGAGGAVALAGQELGARPAAEAARPQADEVRHRLGVLLDAVELLGVGARNARL